jgi:hypothetical protein
LRLKVRLSHGRPGKRGLRISGLLILILEASKTYAMFESTTGQEERNHSLDIFVKQFCRKGFVIEN